MRNIHWKHISNLIFGMSALLYANWFWHSLDGRWFNPHWTTDDAVQQAYPFLKVLNPELFPNDLITTVMEGYLAPLHYWLNYFLTYLTQNPIMTGHWVMFIQLASALAFLFLAVKHVCSSYAPAFFACAWLLHTRTVIMRMTGGLPRGWAVPILAGFVYCALTGRHRLLLVIIGLGCILNPPATFLVACSYGIWLLFLSYRLSSRRSGLLALKELLIVSPVFILTVWLVLQRPPEVGNMVSYTEAIQMPAFNQGGRFPFLPLSTIESHLHRFGYNPFINRLEQPAFAFIKDWGWAFILLGVLTIFSASLRRDRPAAHPALWCLLLGIAIVYLASRQLLFHLYVPDRHLLVPLSVFLITTFTTGFWNIGFYSGKTANYFRASLLLFTLTVAVFLGSGWGLTGDANFNYHYRRQGQAFEWLANNTAVDAVIAGHPTHVNPVTLFAKRKVYVSSEIAHPFYPVFYKEMERRLEISLRAHYAKTQKEFLALLENEKIDYFVFSRQRFYGKSLRTERYYEPLNDLVKELTAGDFNDYAYKQLPAKVNLSDFPFMPFRDDHSVIIDLNLYKKFMKENPNWPEQ